MHKESECRYGPAHRPGVAAGGDKAFQGFDYSTGSDDDKAIFCSRSHLHLLGRRFWTSQRHAMLKTGPSTGSTLRITGNPQRQSSLYFAVVLPNARARLLSPNRGPCGDFRHR